MLILIFFLQGCKKDNFENATDPYGKLYFSGDTGTYIVYDVVEIKFNDFNNTSDTSYYKLKESIESEFFDNSNRASDRIERYTKLADTLPWIIKNVYYSTIINTHIERVEENKRLVKLSMPITDESTWNSNQFNSDKELYTFYDGIHQPRNIGTFSFDSTISTTVVPVLNNIEEQASEEVYAIHIGLVYKKYISIVKSITGVKRGVKIYYTLNSYGKN
ncbi:MAG: hypothetical protein H7321_04345 [Bacteroidia bacterium]|nr:hypothetical protein [Bacteroidia bacterium]